MFLNRLIVENYRSIEFLDVKFEKGKNVIIGRNNAGKSNIIKAIGLLLGEQNPTYGKYENVRESDFFTRKEKQRDALITSNRIVIYGEIAKGKSEHFSLDKIEEFSYSGSYMLTKPYSFDEINESNFDEIVNKIYSVDFSNKNHKFYFKIQNMAKFEYFNFSDVQLFGYLFKAERSEDGISKDMRLLVKDKEGQWWLFERPFVRTEVLQSAIIPSFRDPSTQLRLTQWSWYGKLMKYLIKKHADSNEKLQHALNVLRSASEEIFGEIKSEIENSTLDVAFPGAEIYFQLAEDTKPDLHKNVVIHIDDGFKSNLFDKGAGIQSATIIGLFTYYTQHVNTKTGALLCIEEPELYLHPHACRVVNNRLENFIGEKKEGTNQVILTTHSPEFVKPGKNKLNIILVRKDNNATQARNINIDGYKHLLVDSSYSELFFADKVIICEGYDNYVLKFIAEKQLDENNISVIGVGGKDNISEFAKLTTKLGIDTYILADFDYLLRDQTNEGKKFGAKPHESVENLPLEEIVKQGGNKLRSEVAKLRNRIKSDKKELFYTAKHLDDFKDENEKSWIKKVLQNLRDNGIWILDGEIEDYIIDKAVLSDKGKFNRDSILKVSKKISSEDANVESIFETVEFKQFINMIIDK